MVGILSLPVSGAPGFCHFRFWYSVYSSTVPVHLVQHPLAQDALLHLRDRTTRTGHFRRLAHRMSLLLAIEATRDLRSSPKRVDTPLEPVDGQALEADIVVVPVLRAGLGMVEALLELIPHARVGHIGLERDEHTAVASQDLREAAARSLA